MLYNPRLTKLNLLNAASDGKKSIYIDLRKVALELNILSQKMVSSLFVLLLYIIVNSYGHVGMVISPNHTFFLGKLEQTVNQYFVHILMLVTDNNPS